MPSVDTSRPAIIVGSDLAGLGIAQSLGSQGVTCWICDNDRAIGAFSRFTRYWRLPDPEIDEVGVIDRIIELVEGLAVRPVIFPAADRFAQCLARHVARLEKVATVCVANAEAVDLLLDKRRFGAWAQERSLSHPRTIVGSAFEADGSLEFPVGAKWAHREWSNAAALDQPLRGELVDLRFQTIADPAAWADYAARHRDYLDYVIVQEYVRGLSSDNYSVGLYVDRDSEIRGLFAGRKVRGFPAEFGDCVVGQNDVLPDDVVEEVAGVVRALSYSGIAEVDYKRDNVTGRFRIIEINPRSWRWVAATTGSEADIPWIAYRDMTGQEVGTTFVNDRPGRVKYVEVLRDFVNVQFRYRFDYPAWRQNPWTWWRDLQAESLVVAEFNRRDWPVALCSLFVLLPRGVWNVALRKLKQRKAA